VLYGMGFRPAFLAARGAVLRRDRERVARALQANADKARQMRTLLPANRELLESLTPMRGVAGLAASLTSGRNTAAQAANDIQMGRFPMEVLLEDQGEPALAAGGRRR